jgi:hypothetical protein
MRTHLITGPAAIPLMLRTAPAHGSGGLVVEMTDGTSQTNAEFRRNVGFYYDLVKANVERIVKGLTAELENLAVTGVGVTPAGCARRKCTLRPHRAEPAPEAAIAAGADILRGAGITCCLPRRGAR